MIIDGKYRGMTLIRHNVQTFVYKRSKTRRSDKTGLGAKGRQRSQNPAANTKLNSYFLFTSLASHVMSAGASLRQATSSSGEKVVARDAANMQGTF